MVTKSFLFCKMSTYKNNVIKFKHAKNDNFVIMLINLQFFIVNESLTNSDAIANSNSPRNSFIN